MLGVEADAFTSAGNRAEQRAGNRALQHVNLVETPSPQFQYKFDFVRQLSMEGWSSIALFSGIPNEELVDVRNAFHDIGVTRTKHPNDLGLWVSLTKIAQEGDDQQRVSDVAVVDHED